MLKADFKAYAKAIGARGKEVSKLSCQEQVVLEEHERLSPHLLFEIIRRDGDEELSRPAKACQGLAFFRIYCRNTDIVFFFIQGCINNVSAG